MKTLIGVSSIVLSIIGIIVALIPFGDYTGMIIIALPLIVSISAIFVAKEKTWIKVVGIIFTLVCIGSMTLSYFNMKMVSSLDDGLNKLNEITNEMKDVNNETDSTANSLLDALSDEIKNIDTTEKK